MNNYKTGIFNNRLAQIISKEVKNIYDNKNREEGEYIEYFLKYIDSEENYPRYQTVYDNNKIPNKK